MGKKAWARYLALILAAVTLSLALVGLAGCGGGENGAPSGNGTLKVGVRADVVGFGYLNEGTGKYYGLEIDIANEMAHRMGYTDVEFVTVLPETRKDMLLNGEVDCLIACYSIAESREKNFDFSAPYYQDDSVVMVENSSLITSLDQLKGLTLGTMSGANTAPQLLQCLVEKGFTNGEVVTQTEDKSITQFDNFRLVQVPSYAELSNCLEEGTIDAVCMDGCIAYAYQSDDRALLDFSVAAQEYGVATQKDSALSKPVADTIQSMLDDGTIATLHDKWD